MVKIHHKYQIMLLYVMDCWPVKVQKEGCMDLNLNYSMNDGGDHIISYQSVSRRAADHMCRRAVYQLPVPSTATAAEKQIFK